MEPTFYIYRVAKFWKRLYWTGNYKVGKGESRWAIPQAVTDRQNIDGKVCVDRGLWHTGSGPGCSNLIEHEIATIKDAFPEFKDDEFGYCEYEHLPQADKVCAMEETPEFENSDEPWDTERYEK